MWVFLSMPLIEEVFGKDVILMGLDAVFNCTEKKVLNSAVIFKTEEPFTVHRSFGGSKLLKSLNVFL